ncbi:STE20 family protein kinase [Tieghemostelium lacteum]|uniref:Serine/threonine-protein kinase 1 n=1 Tax=Tieghemostelium lacteum TaxID=361077 RepID=A0A151ZJV1_TIELA|nr:STE20 family protein kinase [Tieghemostelium lacteum]|eukprot:KYQ94160.1 STE20 family protein kinase [Tieghemostelium lacteum]
MDSKGIIHRDIKPANVMIDCYGNARLIDFGVGDDQKANWSNLVAGTVTCMSPEMLRDGYYNGYNNDVWSLGVLLFTMVTGYHPFDKDVGGHYRQRFNGNHYKTWLMSELVTSTIRVDYQVPYGVSLECKDLIEKCMTSIGTPRIKSDVILRHFWFKKCSNDSNMRSNGLVINMPFSPLNKFK